MRSTGSYNADVLVYALAQPQEVVYGVEMEDEEREYATEIHVHPVQSCFRTTGKSGPYKICAPMERIFQRFFGNDFVVGCFYS